MGYFSSEMLNKRRWTSAFDKIQKKHREKKYGKPLVGGGFLNLELNRSKILKSLHADFQSGITQFKPAQRIQAYVGGKVRWISKLELEDQIVHSVAAGILNDLLEAQYSSRLFSYRKGHSSWAAIQMLTDFIRAHRLQFKIPTQRGIFVLKRDVSAYGDNIPVHEKAELWRELSRLTSKSQKIDAADIELMKKLLRPFYKNGDQSEFSLSIGIPTGSPLSNPVLNLYLTSMDRRLEKFSSAIYFRFGDDILFATTNLEDAQFAEQIMEQQIGLKHLSFSKKKSHNFFFNGAGKHHPSWPEAWPGRSSFEHLGMRIDFRAEVSLSQAKIAAFQKDVKTRIADTIHALKRSGLSHSFSALSHLINELLSQGNPHRFAFLDLAYQAATSRRSLNQLDRILWRELSSAIADQEYPFCLRVLPPKEIRQMIELQSLTNLKNKSFKTAKAAKG